MGWSPPIRLSLRSHCLGLGARHVDADDGFGGLWFGRGLLGFGRGLLWFGFLWFGFLWFGRGLLWFGRSVRPARHGLKRRDPFHTGRPPSGRSGTLVHVGTIRLLDLVCHPSPGGRLEKRVCKFTIAWIHCWSPFPTGGPAHIQIFFQVLPA